MGSHIARPEPIEGRARGSWFDKLTMSVISVFATAVAAQIALGAQQAPDFEAKVRPILAANCYDCHGDQQYGGLRLDSRDAILKGGASGPAVVPGDPDRSLLIQAIRQSNEKLKMPKGG